jgi:hypothetical protein
MSQRSDKETSNFSQNMHHQGKAAFGAGPWTEPEKIEVRERPAAAPSTRGEIRPAAAPTRADEHPPCRLGDRILTGLAILSLGMLIVGALGAYLSNDSQHVATTTHSEDAAPPPALAAATDARFLQLENRLTQLDEGYAQRLHALATKLEQTVDPYGARLAKLEHRLETAASPEGDGGRTPGAATVPVDATSYEARLSAIESRLDQAYAPSQAALRDLENRMEQGYASHDARLREMESRLMQVQLPYEQRLQALEQQLIYDSARLDYLSAEMETLVDDKAALVQASATLKNDPPAALPPGRAAAPWTPTETNPAPVAPGEVRPDMPPATTVTKTSPLPVDAPAAPATRPVATPQDTAGAAVTGPVATPVDMAAATVSVPGPAAKDTVPPPMPETAGSVVNDTAPAGAPATDATATPETGTARTTPPPAIDRVEATLTSPQPVETAPRGIDRENTRTSDGKGAWIINLASYASESIAARKLADFKHKGVSAEQTVATVNGKTIYRVCISGFDTRKSAMEQAETVRAQLGLKETWITRR